MPSNEKRFPSRLISISMVLAPFCGFLASLIGFQGAGEIEGELIFISMHTERHLASNALWLASSFFFIPTAIGLLALVPDRLYKWGLLSATLLLLGGFGHGVVISYSLVQIPLLESNLNQEAVATFIAMEMYDHTAFFMLLVMFLGLYIGLLGYAVVLWRGDVAPVWVAILIVIALILGLAWNHPAKNEVMMGLLTIALGFFAYELW